MTKILKGLPNKTGVYELFDAEGNLLYIGKAIDIKKRVRQHFERPHGERIGEMLKQVARVEYKLADTAIEALILESLLINRLQPKYNIRSKDDKSFLGVYVTDEDFPRVFPARLTLRNLPRGKFYGPYTSSRQVRQALKILRRTFPWCNDPPSSLDKTRDFGDARRACFYYHIGQCPGPCAGKTSKKDYRKIINRLKLFLSGRKKDVAAEIKGEMKTASRSHDFEGAARLRDQLYALEHIRDTALVVRGEPELSINNLPARQVGYQLKNPQFSIRIEGYDISNISGRYAVGSMVVFVNEKPDNSQYRKFKIRTVEGVDDVAMMAEVIRRRLNHTEWPKPGTIIIDGGVGHYSAVKKLVGDIPLVAVAKGPKRKKSDLYFGKFSILYPPAKQAGSQLSISELERLATRVRDEAHRFAINYHRQLRSRAMA